MERYIKSKNDLEKKINDLGLRLGRYFWEGLGTKAFSYIFPRLTGTFKVC